MQTLSELLKQVKNGGLDPGKGQTIPNEHSRRKHTMRPFWSAVRLPVRLPVRLIAAGIKRAGYGRGHIVQFHDGKRWSNDWRSQSPCRIYKIQRVSIRESVYFGRAGLRFGRRGQQPGLSPVFFFFSNYPIHHIFNMILLKFLFTQFHLIFLLIFPNYPIFLLIFPNYPKFLLIFPKYP
jgi:hypothetical protein